MSPRTLSVFAVEGIGEITAGDDLAAVIEAAAGGDLQEGDILAVTSKILSKAEGRLLPAADATVLADAWRLAAKLRNAMMLWRGRPTDSLPAYVRDLDGIARLAGYPPASASHLDEEYQRTTRRARTVVERVFYG